MQLSHLSTSLWALSCPRASIDCDNVLCCLCHAVTDAETVRLTAPWLPNTINHWCRVGLLPKDKILAFFKAALLQLSDLDFDEFCASIDNKMRDTLAAAMLAGAAREYRENHAIHTQDPQLDPLGALFLSLGTLVQQLLRQDHCGHFKCMFCCRDLWRRNS